MRSQTFKIIECKAKSIFFIKGANRREFLPSITAFAIINQRGSKQYNISSRIAYELVRRVTRARFWNKRV